MTLAVASYPSSVTFGDTFSQGRRLLLKTNIIFYKNNIAVGEKAFA